MNLATVTITSGDYENLATEASITFTQGNSYVLQALDPIVVCEASSEPTSGGFYILDQKPFQYTAGTGNLYVKAITGKATINIAE